MKSSVVALTLGTACLAAGVAAVLIWERPNAERPVSAARFAPAETLLFAECPDLAATAGRWRETDLSQMLQEPEVQAFLAQPLAALENGKGFPAALADLARTQPRQAFLAVADLNQNMPHAVGGLALGGGRAAMDALIAQARAQVQTASPQGQWERQDYGGFQIESFRTGGITLAWAFAKDWYFAANDVELLKGTLDRFTGKLATSLENAPFYRRCGRFLPARPDFRLFAQSGALSDRLLTHWITPAQETQPEEKSAAQPSIRAAALASRFEGRRMRDTLFLYRPGAKLEPSLNGKTLGLTTPTTLFYGALAPRAASTTPSQRGNPKQPAPGAIPVEFLQAAALNPPPATLAQFQTAFGPEHALLLDWPEKTAQPGLFLASEIRDPAAARRFVESAFRAWARSEASGVSLWTFAGNSPDQARFHPSVALTSRHFLAGLSPESLQPFASLANAPLPGGPTLQQSPAFLGAMAAVPRPQTAVAYLDARPLFERLYGILRPAALLWGNGMQPPGGAVDFSKLPSAEVIARHLSPLSLSAVQTEGGTLVESTGPVSFLEIGAGLGGIVLRAALPLKPSPGVRKDAPRQPMAPLEGPAPSTP
ncbi:MAG: hypothetical protein PHQ12_05220 [Chthoniobacteraceae bacterium]|nr:hypothetical protein [Chthoniobacteraceae bacterium]